MLAVMLLAAGVGATIRLETQGPDEAEAMTAMVTEGTGKGVVRPQNADPAGVVAVQRDMKPGTNALLCNHTGRRSMAFRVLSPPLSPSPFRAI